MVHFMRLKLRSCLPLCLSLISGMAMSDVPSVEEKAVEYLTKSTKGESHGVALLLARDGKIIFQRGFGFADVEKKISVTPTTKFRIGSVTKQFTATAMLKLAEEKKLTLDDPLAKYFPDIPHAGEIKLHQLLTHVSGIRSFTDRVDFLQKVIKPIEPSALIASMKDDKPDFEPGKGFHYNNSAYFLAGEIVAKVSGISFAAYLEETFFKPLGMKNTGIYKNESPPAEAAKGYSVVDGKPQPALEWDMSWAGGAGALYSTVEDLFLWSEALHGGKILNADSYKRLTTPVVLPKGVDGMSYGFGLVVADIHGLPTFGHGGGLNGWSSDLVYYPAQRTTIAVLTNALPPKSGLEPAVISQNLAEKFLAAEIKKLPAAKVDASVDPKTFAAFVGRYDYKTAILTVTVEKDRLFAQLTGQEKYEIFPKGPGEFFWKVTKAEVKFLTNDKGEITAAEHRQGGNTFKAARLPDAPEVKLTDAELDAILGDYEYSPKMILTVTRQDKQIFAKMTGQPVAPIFPKSATEFEWKIVPASIEFVKNADGKVTKGIHSQGGQKIEARKVK